MSATTWVKGLLASPCPGQVSGPLLQDFTAKPSLLQHIVGDQCVNAAEHMPALDRS